MAQSSLKKQIVENMSLKETDELLEIWKNGDPSEWSDTAFEVVKEILLERLGEIPPQESEKEVPLDDEDEPLYNENKLFRISMWAKTLSWVILAIYVISFLGRIITDAQGLLNSSNTVFLILTWIGLLGSPALGLMYFLILQTISEGILVLIELDDKVIQILTRHNK